MKKKICWLTSEESFLNNYGAVLQGYALNYILDKPDYEPVIVKYKGGMVTPFSKLTLAKKVRRCFGMIKRKTFNFFHVKRNFLFLKYKKQLKERDDKFNLFYSQNFKFENKERINWDSLEKKEIKADVYLCGSDQIWNPYFKGGQNDLGYFLSFANRKKLIISYAPSFGCSSLPKKSQANIKELLSAFDYISVREETGKNIILKETGLPCEVVLDPTLLLEKCEWDKISNISKQLPEKYILVYRFNDNEKMKNIINDISNIINLPVVVLPLSELSIKKDNDWYKYIEAGPREFIGAISKASLVCTDSFHATVFSLIFNIPFLVFERENFNKDGNSMNSRIYDLLEKGKLKDRIVKEMPNVDEIFNIDFSCFNENVLSERSRSLKWLEGALADVDNRKK